MSYIRDIRSEIVWLCERLKDESLEEYDRPFLEQEIKRLSKIQKNKEMSKK